MIRACMRMTMLAVPLIAGALGCTASKSWLALRDSEQAGPQTGLSSKRMMTIGRMLERQGRTAQARRVYTSVAKLEPAHQEAARRLERLIAYERKLKGLKASPQIAQRTKQARQPAGNEELLGDVPVAVGDAAQLPEPGHPLPSAREPALAEKSLAAAAESTLAANSSSAGDAPDVDKSSGWDVISPRSSHEQPITSPQPPANDIAKAVLTGEATGNGRQDFLVEVAAAEDSELQGLVGTLNVLRPLAQKLEDDDPEVRKDAVVQLALKGAGAKPVLPALFKRLTDDDAGVRVQAARAIWEIDENGEQVIPALSELVGDRQAVVCCMAAFLLGEIGPRAEKALPGLRKLLPDTRGVVRVHVAEAIARIDPRDDAARGALTESLADADSDVRWLATCAFRSAAAANDPQVIERLIGVLQDDDPRVREAAALTLSAFGPSAKQSVPILRKAVKEDDPRVREAAAIALANIEFDESTRNE